MLKHVYRVEELQDADTTTNIGINYWEEDEQYRPHIEHAKGMLTDYTGEDETEVELPEDVEELPDVEDQS